MKWAQQYVDLKEGDWLAVDGKVLNSTITDCNNSYQNFVTMVSVFAHKRGQVLHVAKMENKKESEIPTVRALLESLDIQGCVFSMDALHCQKKQLS